MTPSTVSDIVSDVLEKQDSDTSSSSDVFAADLLRGHTETIVLAVLSRGDSYGFEIFKTIRDATGGAYEIKEATLYASYRRLLKDGLVEAYWGDETQGGRRKYYRITDAGQAVYRDNVRAWVLTRGIIDSLLDLGQLPGSRDSRPGRQRS
jgi:DNA-binding PadR family transcriptional regulator